MSATWEQFEELIKEEMRKVYSEIAIGHAMDPRNVGNMESADGFAKITGPCGDTMEVWLKVSNETIIEATAVPALLQAVWLLRWPKKRVSLRPGRLTSKMS